MKKEIWKPIDTHYGYDVSNLGRVRSPRNLIVEPFMSEGVLYVDIDTKIKSVSLLVLEMFSPAKPESQSSREYTIPCKRVYQIEANTGRILNTFDSLREASRITEVPSAGISQVCNRRRNLAGGFMWEFAKKNI